MLVRPLAVDDDRMIACLFDETMLLGASLDRLPVAFDGYRVVNLGWYLGSGRGDAAVAVDATGSIVGYALVCSDGSAAARYAARKSVSLCGRVVAAGVTGRLDHHSREFYRARARDMGALVLARRSPPASVHAHLNVRHGSRSMTAARALVDHIDARCRAAGHDAWYGELNEREGSRRRAIERLGMTVVDVTPNRTMSRLLGCPVQRLTLVRRVSDERQRPRD